MGVAAMIVTCLTAASDHGTNLITVWASLHAD